MSAPRDALTGRALATALFDAGLAPIGTTRLEALEGPFYYTKRGEQWRPWASLDAVAHLPLRFELGIYVDEGYWLVYCEWQDGWEYEEALVFADLPAAIGRLVLRLHALQQKAVSDE